MNTRLLESLSVFFFIVISAFMVADMANTLVRGAMRVTSSPALVKTIKKPVAPSSPVAKGQGAFPPAEATPPPVTLVGTTTGAYPYAVLIAQGKQQELYRLKDDVGGGWLIDEIGANRVVLKNGAHKEVLEMKFIETPPKAGAAGTRLGMRLDPREVEGALADLNKVVTQARAVPYMVGGKIAGYQLFDIVPGSLYTKLGLQNNDVVERVNGVEMNSPDTLYQLFQQIRNQRSIALDVNRSGKRESVNIEIR